MVNTINAKIFVNTFEVRDTMTQQIQFIYLTQDEYDGLEQKNPGRLYFTSDTHRIYRGEDLYASSTYDELQVDEIDVNGIKVDGKNVSLEGHSHKVSDIVDFPNLEELSGYSKEGHTHTKTDIVDFTHNHYKSEIVDFDHIHSKQDIVDFDHNHKMNEITGLIEELDLIKFNEEEIFITEED